MTLCTICGDRFWSSSREETCLDCRTLNLAQAEQARQRSSIPEASVMVQVIPESPELSQAFPWLEEG